MAVPVARVHLKMAHAALPALLPTPSMWKTMLPLLPTPPGVTSILPKPSLAKPAPASRADSDERWDARKAKPLACLASSASSSSGPRKNTTSPPMPGRADSVERWDAHKKAASPALSSSSSGTPSFASSSKWSISRRASSTERWDVHKNRRPLQAKALDDGESSSTGSNDMEEEEEILWKPRGMYAGQGFVVAAPKPSMLPMPTSFLVPVA